jgi:hypothetical protein
MSTHQSQVMNSFEAACKRLSKLARGADGCCCNHLCNSRIHRFGLLVAVREWSPSGTVPKYSYISKGLICPLVQVGCTFALLSDGNVPGGRHSEGVPDLVGSPVGTGTRVHRDTGVTQQRF